MAKIEASEGTDENLQSEGLHYGQDVIISAGFPERLSAESIAAREKRDRARDATIFINDEGVAMSGRMTDGEHQRL